MSTAEIAWRGRMDWRCEKWSEEACDFARRKLRQEGVTHIQDGYEIKPTGFRDRLASLVAGRDVSQVIVVPRMIPIEHGVTSAELRRLVGDAEIMEEVSSNLLLNEGINEMWDLVLAAGGTTAYNNANAQIGVGDSSTAEAATQTDLQAATNKLYKGMNATFPTNPGSNGAQSRDWQSDFTTSEANYVWNEWSIRNGATRDKNMNRKVSSLGTKAVGTWTLTGTVTLS